MKLKYFLIYIGLILTNLPTAGQSGQTGINTTTPDNSAILDIVSNNKGLLIPRVSLSNITDTSLDGGTTPAATGLMIWNTNANVVDGAGKGYYFFDGTAWLPAAPNTLDRAYDQGGNGAGKTITADNGSVEINGTDGFLATGSFGNGTEITSAPNTAQMFFNPVKAAFRAGYVTGNQWDAGEYRNYSFATGYDQIVKFRQSFAANSNNSLDTRSRYSAGFGTQNRAMEPANFVIGANNTSSENNAIAIGNTTRARAKNSLAGGVGNYAISIAEVVLGTYAKRYNRHDDSDTDSDSQIKFYTDDRIFAVGNGTSDTQRSDALEIWKDGSIKINDSYALPKSDGSNGQVMKITANGVKWRHAGTSKDTRTTFTMYADGIYPINSTTDASYEGFHLAIFPEMFDKNNDGIVKIKAVIEYSSLSGTHNLRIKAEDDTTNTAIIPINSLTDTPFGTTGSGILANNFKNWTYSTATPPSATPFHVYLYGKMANSGDEIKIKNCYIFIKDN